MEYWKRRGRANRANRAGRANRVGRADKADKIDCVDRIHGLSAISKPWSKPILGQPIRERPHPGHGSGCDHNHTPDLSNNQSMLFYTTNRRARRASLEELEEHLSKRVALLDPISFSTSCVPHFRSLTRPPSPHTPFVPRSTMAWLDKIIQGLIDDTKRGLIKVEADAKRDREEWVNPPPEDRREILFDQLAALEKSRDEFVIEAENELSELDEDPDTSFEAAMSAAQNHIIHAMAKAHGAWFIKTHAALQAQIDKLDSPVTDPHVSEGPVADLRVSEDPALEEEPAKVASDSNKDQSLSQESTRATKRRRQDISPSVVSQ